jgi:hypothetical protein
MVLSFSKSTTVIHRRDRYSGGKSSPRRRQIYSSLNKYERPLPEMHVYDHLLVGAGR